MFTVYIISFGADKYHSGITKNISRRLTYHNEGKSEITKKNLPIELVFKQQFRSIIEAKAYQLKLLELENANIQKVIDGTLQLTTNVTNKEEVQNKQSSIILPTTYLGNRAYLAQLNNKRIIIDGNEIFKKQSYRSRCTILTSNGLLNLVVPVIKPNGKKTQLKDVKISYESNWQKDHIKAIESAYRKAPYFEFYGEDLIAIIAEKFDKLIDLNIKLSQFLVSAFKFDTVFEIGMEKDETSVEQKIAISPKSRELYKGEVYHQIFNPTGVFEDNLSCLDLLFNHGSWLN